jgi:hypothetical protein
MVSGTAFVDPAAFADNLYAPPYTWPRFVRARARPLPRGDPEARLHDVEEKLSEQFDRLKE